MICYKDMSFCADACICGTEDCGRRLTEEDCKKAIALFLPISYMEFASTCKKYTPLVNEYTSNVC